MVNNLGKSVYLIQNDMNGNLDKIRAVCATVDPSATLDMLVRADIDRNFTDDGTSATNSLRWLNRALQVFSLYFEKLGEDTLKQPAHARGLSVCVQEAYYNSLAKHHNFVVKQLFSVGLRMSPTSEDYLASFNSEHSQGVTTVVAGATEKCQLRRVAGRDLSDLGAMMNQVVGNVTGLFTANKLVP